MQYVVLIFHRRTFAIRYLKSRTMHGAHGNIANCNRDVSSDTSTAFLSLTAIESLGSIHYPMCVILSILEQTELKLKMQTNSHDHQFVYINLNHMPSYLILISA